MYRLIQNIHCFTTRRPAASEIMDPPLTTCIYIQKGTALPLPIGLTESLIREYGVVGLIDRSISHSSPVYVHAIARSTVLSRVHSVDRFLHLRRFFHQSFSLSLEFPYLTAITKPDSIS